MYIPTKYYVRYSFPMIQSIKPYFFIFSTKRYKYNDVIKIYDFLKLIK